MLKHRHSRSGLFQNVSPSKFSDSLASLTPSQSSGSEMSFDASFGSTGSPCSPLPSRLNVSARSSITSSDPMSLSSVSSPSAISIKIFASCLRPDIEYKTLSVGFQTDCRDLIWQLLGKYKMKHRDPKLFYLSMEVMISKTVSKTMVLEDDARPAKLTLCNPWGECKFTLQMKKGGLVRVYDSVLMSGSQYKSLLISEETTVRDVVMILFHCYGLAEGLSATEFSLYEHCRTQNYERKLNSEDRPLAVQDSWLDPDQFRLVLRRAPALKYKVRADLKMNNVNTPVLSHSSIHQIGLPCVPVHDHALADMGARAMQASLIERYSRFFKKYENNIYV